MKVGVYLDDSTPQAGGGHAFQDDIFQALVELAVESKHFFVVFGEGQPRQSFIRPSPNLAFVDLLKLRRKQMKRRVRIKLARAYNRIAFELPGMPLLSRGRSTWIDQQLSDVGIDILWNITPPGIHPDNVPFICTVLDLQHRLQPWFPEVSTEGMWGWREAQYSRLQRAAFVIVGTETGKSEVMRFYQVPQERIKVLPHPTPNFALRENRSGREEDDEEVMRRYQISHEYLFYPAQFWPHKNHVNLLLALRYLRDAFGIEYHLVFVGSDKGNESYVRSVAQKLGLHSNTHFLGFVSQEEMVSLYRQAFALTYLTFFGPENLPPLEAFALGCPVIASRVPGAEEQLGGAALLVDPNNVEQVANGIKQLRDDSDLRQGLVTRGYARASSWTGVDFVRSVFSIFDEFESVRRCWSMH
ncbi:MAG: glycosyltransferase family 1 protein [Thermodesulfobacteriota bacterium]|nr:glycosyltransferase family 1 protein [Thermodesulfobacteriota bacterium]